MKSYIGTKTINAKPMTRAEYNTFRGWKLPENENGADEGYLVEYTDGGKPNVEGFAGYVSWSPKEQFEGAYREFDTAGMPDGIKESHSTIRALWNMGAASLNPDSFSELELLLLEISKRNLPRHVAAA